MNKRVKGTHKALGRGGRACVIEVTLKQPVRKTKAPAPRRPGGK
jgi:hypothetical protein